MSCSLPSIRILAIGASAVLLLAGCAVARLAYDNADWFLVETIDDYVDLNAEQRDWAVQAMRVRMDDHRREELPNYLEPLQQMDAAVARGLESAETDALIAATLSLAQDFALRMVPAVSQILVELDETQMEFLAGEMRERNDDYRVRFALDEIREVRFRKRSKRLIDRIEDWTGPLNDEQVSLVRAARDSMPDSADDWLEHTRKQQSGLLELLAERTDNPGTTRLEVEDYLRGWITLRDADGALLGYAAKVRALTGKLLVDLDGTLTSQQRQHLRAKLQDYSELARGLIDASGTGA